MPAPRHHPPALLPRFGFAGLEADGICESVEQLTRAATGAVGWLLIVRGSGELRGPLGVRRLAAGTVLAVTTRTLRPANLRAGREGWRFRVLLFSGEAGRRYVDFLQRRFGVSHEADVRSAPFTLAAALVRDFAGVPVDGSSDARERRAVEWLAAWHEHLDRQRRSLLEFLRLPRDDPRLRAFAGRSVKDMARQLGYSRSHLTRILRERWGRSPGRVLRGLREQQLLELAGSENLRVRELAGRVGYQSVSAMYAAFRRRHAGTPAEFRRRQSGGRGSQAARRPGSGSPKAPRPDPGREAIRLPPNRRDEVHTSDWDGPYVRLLTCGMRSEPNRTPFDIALTAVVRRCVVVITLAGEAVFEAAGRRLAVGPGMAVAYPSPYNARWHPAPGARRWRRVWLQFHGEWAEQFFAAVVAEFGNVHAIPVRSAPVTKALELIRWLRRGRVEPPYFWSRQAWEWLWIWHEQLARQGVPRSPVWLDPRSSPASVNLARSLAEYARQMGYSVSHLSGKLKTLWNQTPGRVLRQARLDHAAQQLRMTSRSVAAIGVDSGYASAAAFIRAFRKAHGFTPLAYRRQHRR